jgi:hypothetical protein
MRPQFGAVERSRAPTATTTHAVSPASCASRNATPPGVGSAVFGSSTERIRHGVNGCRRRRSSGSARAFWFLALSVATSWQVGMRTDEDRPGLAREELGSSSRFLSYRFPPVYLGSALQAGGRWFEPGTAHFSPPREKWQSPRRSPGRARNESCGLDSRALASQRAASWFVQWPVGLAAQSGWSVAERAHFVHMCGVVEPRDPDQVVALGASTECKRRRHGDGSPSGDRLERACGA